jgi:hypothetical protein
MIEINIHYGTRTEYLATLSSSCDFRVVKGFEQYAKERGGRLSVNRIEDTEEKSVFKDTTAEQFLGSQGVPYDQLQNLPWFDYGNLITWLEEYSELRQKSGVVSDTDKARKFILAGHEAILAYEVAHYELVAQYIKSQGADIFEISSMDGIYELLEQLKGWDDFIVITSLEQQKINKLL